MRTLLLTAFILISSYLLASEPIYLESKVFKCWSLNKNYSLTVIPEESKNWYDLEPTPSAIAVVTRKGEKEPLYFFKLTYENWSDYIISDTGETVVQLISYGYNKKLDDGTVVSVSFSELNVFRNGKLKNKISLDFDFCTYSTKTMYQNPVLNIKDSKYLNLIDDSLYVISYNSIYKINLINGEASIASYEIKLKAYKYKRKKTTPKFLRKYKYYNERLIKKSDI